MYLAALLPSVGQYDVSKRIKTDFRLSQDSPEKFIKKQMAKS